MEGGWWRGCADLRPPRPSVGSCPMERKHHLPQFPLFLEFSQPGWMFEMFDTSVCHQWKHQWDKSISSLLPKECRQFSPLAFNEQIWDGFVPHLGKLVAEKTPPKNISNHPMPMVQLTKCSFFFMFFPWNNWDCQVGTEGELNLGEKGSLAVSHQAPSYSLFDKQPCSAKILRIWIR